MDDGHQRRNNGLGIVVLVNIAPVNHAVCTFGHQSRRFRQYIAQVLTPPAPHQHRAPRRLDHLVKVLRVTGRIGLDDIGSHFRGKTNQRNDFFGIAIHLITAAHIIRQHDQRFDHQRHPETMAIGAHAADVFNTLTKELRFVRQHEQVHDDAGGIHFQRADDRVMIILKLRPHGPVAC